MKRRKERGSPRLMSVPIASIYANTQDRQIFDDAHIQDLADDMKVSDWCQPPTVRPADRQKAPEGKKYEIVCGECRYRAMLLNGETEIDVIVEELSDEDALMRQWAENRDRRDLRPIEEARAIQRRQKALGWDVATASRKLSMAESTIRDRLALLRCIDEVQVLLERNAIQVSYALVLSRMSPPAQHMALPCLATALNYEAFRRECAEIQSRVDQMLLPGYDEFGDVYQLALADWTESQSQAETTDHRLYPSIEGLPAVPRARTHTLSLAMYIETLANSADAKLQEYAMLLGYIYNEWLRARRIKRRTT